MWATRVRLSRSLRQFDLRSYRRGKVSDARQSLCRTSDPSHHRGLGLDNPDAALHNLEVDHVECSSHPLRCDYLVVCTAALECDEPAINP